jgi:tryptophan synthase alpha chain
MNRISAKFQELKELEKTAFMPFFVAGDPDFSRSLTFIRHALPFADLLELGFPYSDPLADGPTIQNADARALLSGMNPDTVFDLIKAIRKISEVPITVLVYANLVYQRGIERFYRDAQDAGIDGVLVPDVPMEEAGPFVAAARKFGISPIFLVTLTTNKERLKKILLNAHGYLYVVSLLGVTGARKSLSQELAHLLARIKAQTGLPLAVGFGISKRSHITALAKAGADGVIVGSALIKAIEEDIEKKGVGSRALVRSLNSLVPRHPPKRISRK